VNARSLPHLILAVRSLTVAGSLGDDDGVSPSSSEEGSEMASVERGGVLARSERPSVAVRASDAEREAVVARLQHAVGEGRLDADEAGQRIAAVYAARLRAELHEPVADLPASADPPVGALSWEQLWTHLLWRARLMLHGPGAPCPGAVARRQAAVVLLGATAVLWTAVWVLLGAIAP
jgi:hypothetical protein